MECGTDANVVRSPRRVLITIVAVKTTDTASSRFSIVPDQHRVSDSLAM